MSELSNWASRLLFPDRNKAEFDKFVQEVNDESVEHLSFQQDADGPIDFRRTFEQLPQDVILDEVTKDISYLKSLDSILQDRAQGNKEYGQCVSKSRSAHEHFQQCTPESNLQRLLEAFTAYTETDAAQARLLQQTDLRRALGDTRADAQRRLTDFQREVASAERDLFSSEKKLNKSKDHLDKYLRQEMTANSTDGEAGGPSKAPSSQNTSPLFGATLSKSTVHGNGGALTAGGAALTTGGAAILHAGAPVATSSIYTDREAALTDDYNVQKYERDIRDDVRGLLRAITNKDQALSASRRAYQQLDRTAKSAVVEALRTSVIREREAHDARDVALQALERTLASYSSGGDEEAFIERFGSEDTCFIQSGQALSILGDLGVGQKVGQGQSQTNGEGHRPRTRTGSAADTPAPSAPPAPTNTTAPHSARANSVSVSAPATEGKGHGFSLFSAFKKDKEEPGTSSSSCTPKPPPPPLDSATQGPSRSSMQTVPISYDEPSASTGDMSAPALEPQGPQRSAEELSGVLMDYLSRVFYMTNRAQLSPAYLSIILGRGAANARVTSSAAVDTSAESPLASPPGPAVALQGVPLDVLLLCRDWKKDPSCASLPEISSLQVAYTVPLIEAVNDIIEIVETDEGRSAFVACLNQFRSKQVNVGISFGWLGAVLWTVLDFCHGYNDIHSAKIIMMLAQTFYYRDCDVHEQTGSVSEKAATAATAAIDGEEDDDEGEGQRKTDDRIYLTVLLTSHSLWRDPKFWEQALWTCVIEQLSAMPHQKLWYDMSKEERERAVRMVHDVTFSQVL